jgi:hypothetical protein
MFDKGLPVMEDIIISWNNFKECFYEIWNNIKKRQKYWGTGQ